MTDDRMEGATKQGVGRVQDAIGGLMGDDKGQLKGKLNEAAGKAQDVYGQAKDKAQVALDQAQDFTRDKPGQALAIGVGVGVVLGLILGGGKKVVYVRK